MSAIPDGFQTITPYIAVSDGDGALAFYEKALGAETLNAMRVPDTNKIMHATLQLGTSKLFLTEGAERFPSPTGPECGSHFYLYVDDVDAAHATALDAGMTELSAPVDMFWGDRMSGLQCPYNHTWNLSTHVRDVTPEEMAAAMEQMGS